MKEKYKKHKELLIYLIFIITFAVTLAISCIFAFEKNDNGINFNDDEDFVNTSVDELLGKRVDFFNGYIWKNNIKNGGCFFHDGYDGNTGGDRYINSIYDITYDENKKAMKLTSYSNGWSYANGSILSKERVEAWANERTIKKRTWDNKNKKWIDTTLEITTDDVIGELIYAVSRDGNIKNVFKALGNLMANGYTVKDPLMVLQYNDSHELVEISGSNGESTDDDPFGNTAATYNNYKQLTKDKSCTPSEKSETVTMDDGDYTIVGPFKMTFSGKGIDQLFISDMNNKKVENIGNIYWALTPSTNKNDWSNDFNQNNNGKNDYTLNGKKFYMAINTNNLPEQDYKITIVQEEFKYYKSRIIIIGGNVQQQYGQYTSYAGKNEIIRGKAEWTITPNRGTTLQIEKVDEQDKKTPLQGAEFKIYANIGENKGWLNTDNGAKTVEKYEDAKTYTTNKAGLITINGLPNGTYYIYETKAPDGYTLLGEEGHNKGEDGVPTPKQTDWVYVEKQTLEKGKAGQTNPVKITKTNTKAMTLNVIKQDPTEMVNGEPKKLAGAEFKIYVENKGWLQGTAEGPKTFVAEGSHEESEEGKELFIKGSRVEGTTFTSTEEGLKIKSLPYGTYYIYETKAPDGYTLKGQESKEKPNKNIPEPIGKEKGSWILADIKTLSPSSDEQTTTLEVESVIDNVPLGSLIVDKKDKNDPKTSVKAKVLIYAELTNANSEIKGWVKNGENIKEYDTDIANAQQYDTNTEINDLKPGKYYVYEVGVQDGYDLSEQEDQAERVGGIPAPETGVYLGMAVVGANEQGILDTAILPAKNTPLGKLEVKKIDSRDAEKDNPPLLDAKVKIYAADEKGWLSGDVKGKKTYNNTAQNATVYNTLSSEIENFSETEVYDQTITNLKHGTYYIYETGAPKGYKLADQTGATMSEKQKTIGDQLGNPKEDWIYLGTVDVKDENNNNPTVSIGENSKTVKVRGKVWLDKPDTKVQSKDDIYVPDTADELLKGIKVNLCKGNGKNKETISTVYTGDNGQYEFTHTREEEALKYEDIDGEAYVEFEYDNGQYVVVDSFAGGDAYKADNSKAKEESMDKDELFDDNLGADKKYPTGIAVTKTNLLDYYNEIDDECVVENINLGLREKHDPTLAVEENLLYAKVLMNGYTYTYDYQTGTITPNDDEDYYKYTPKTLIQNTGMTTFGLTLNPTDIASTLNNGNDLQIYLTYSIDVTNNEVTNYEDQYNEERLYLTSLTNAFDTERLTLNTEYNDGTGHIEDFKLWSVEGNTAKYNLAADKHFANGIAPGKEENQEVIGGKKRTYIQFKVNDDAIEKMFTANKDDLRLNKEPTIARAEGYHAYTRTDNLWNHSENVEDRMYEDKEHKEQLKDIYDDSALKDTNEPYYLHKSKKCEGASDSVYVVVKLGEERTITGNVFEDTKPPDEKVNKGNGYLDEKENKVSGVKVELLTASDHKTAVRYHLNEDRTTTKISSAEITNDKGEYTISGVTPGEYVIRFTYGNGDQTIKDVNGTEIKNADGTSKTITSTNYRATVINTEPDKATRTIREAIEATNITILGENASAATEKLANDLKVNNKKEARNTLQWYNNYANKDLGYSTAIDDKAASEAGKYVYREGKAVYVDNAGKKIEIKANPAEAYTAAMAILIENTENNSGVVEYDEDGIVRVGSMPYKNFNFGLIEGYGPDLTIEKKITNVDFTNQLNVKTVSGNPATTDSPYMTDLDKSSKDGSHNVKLEMDSDLIYGSTVDVTYTITIANQNSIIDYPDYINWYRFGEVPEHPTATPVTIEEVTDKLDLKYDVKTAQDIKVASGQVKVNSVKKEENGNTVTMTGWGEIEQGANVSTSYTVRARLSSENDTNYENEAAITEISSGKPLIMPLEWNWEDDTSLTIYPPTGENRSTTYWIAGIISLIVLATGFVVIKKTVLK